MKANDQGQVILHRPSMSCTQYLSNNKADLSPSHNGFAIFLIPRQISSHVRSYHKTDFFKFTFSRSSLLLPNRVASTFGLSAGFHRGK